MPLIEPNVNIRRSHSKHGLIGLGCRAHCNRYRPALSEVHRLGNHDVVFLILKPGSVNGFSVAGIHEDLRIELP